MSASAYHPLYEAITWDMRPCRIGKCNHDQLAGWSPQIDLACLQVQHVTSNHELFDSSEKQSAQVQWRQDVWGCPLHANNVVYT